MSNKHKTLDYRDPAMGRIRQFMEYARRLDEDIFDAYYLEGYTQDDIGKVLGISRSAVNKRLIKRHHRGHQASAI